MRTSQTEITNLFKIYAIFSVAFLLSLGAYSLMSPTSSTSSIPSFSPMLSISSIFPTLSLLQTSNVSATDSPSDCDPTTHTTSSGSICSDSNSNLSVSVSNNPLAYYISVSSSHGSSGTPVSLSYSQDGSSGGTLGNVVSSSDSVYLETNSPLNHQLLLSTSGTHSESGIPSSIVANNLTGTNTETTTESGNTSLVTNTYIAPVGNVTTSSLNSATALGDNTWGFALSSSTSGIETNNFNTASEYESTDTTTLNSNKYATVPTNNNQVLLLQDTEPTSTTTIYYGVKADRNIPAGNYSNTVLYTALAEQPSEIRVSGPSGLNPTIDMASPNQTLTIYTSINTTSIQGETAAVKLYQTENNTLVEKGTCASPTVALDANNYLYVTCTTPVLSAGTYTVELTLTNLGRVLTAENSVTYSGDPLDGIETMQTFTSAACNRLPEADTAGNNIYTLKDSRDNKPYKIARLADNNCWMVQNLALDGGRTLTPSDSNVIANRTLAANISNGTSSSWDTVQIYSGNANSTTTDCGTYPDCIVSDVKYGNLYNWNAATAGVGKQATTGTVTESVCPLGWQLPNNTNTKSYNRLMSAYNLPTGSGTNPSAVKDIQKNPLNFPLSGYYDQYSTSQINTAGYWSRTVYTDNSNGAYYLYFNSESGAFAPRNNYNKWRGYSVRCVFGS